jgi:DNA-binding phage protein
MPLLHEVEVAAAAYHEAVEAVEAGRVKLYAAIITAVSEGVPAARVARSAGLSRERVRQIVEAHGGRVE